MTNARLTQPAPASPSSRSSGHFVNLPGAELGFASPGEIWIDSTAAGWGWSLNGAAGRMDPTPVVAHELGHLLGFAHSERGVMGAALAFGTSLIPQAVSLATSSSVSVGATAAAPVVLARAELGSAQVQMAQLGVVGVFLAPSSAPAGVALDLGTQSTVLLPTSPPVASWLDQGSPATTAPAFALPNFGLIRDSGNWMSGGDEYADQPAKPTPWLDLFDTPIELESVTLSGVWVIPPLMAPRQAILGVGTQASPAPD